MIFTHTEQPAIGTSDRKHGDACTTQYTIHDKKLNDKRGDMSTPPTNHITMNKYPKYRTRPIPPHLPAFAYAASTANTVSPSTLRSRNHISCTTSSAHSASPSHARIRVSSAYVRLSAKLCPEIPGCCFAHSKNLPPPDPCLGVCTHARKRLLKLLWMVLFYFLFENLFSYTNDNYRPFFFLAEFS